MKIACAVAATAAVVAACKWIQYKLITTALIHIMLSKGMEVNEREVKQHMDLCIRKWASSIVKRNSLPRRL